MTLTQAHDQDLVMTECLSSFLNTHRRTRLLIFRERGEEEEREGEKDQCVDRVASPTHPDQGLNPQPRYML